MSSIVAINTNLGLVEHMTVAGAVNTHIFLDFLDQLYHTLSGSPDVVIFMDNLTVHHTKLVGERLKLFEW